MGGVWMWCGHGFEIHLWDWACPLVLLLFAMKMTCLRKVLFQGRWETCGGARNPTTGWNQAQPSSASITSQTSVNSQTCEQSIRDFCWSPLRFLWLFVMQCASQMHLLSRVALGRWGEAHSALCWVGLRSLRRGGGFGALETSKLLLSVARWPIKMAVPFSPRHGSETQSPELPEMWEELREQL